MATENQDTTMESTETSIQKTEDVLVVSNETSIQKNEERDWSTRQDPSFIVLFKGNTTDQTRRYFEDYVECEMKLFRKQYNIPNNVRVYLINETDDNEVNVEDLPYDYSYELRKNKQNIPLTHKCFSIAIESIIYGVNGHDVLHRRWLDIYTSRSKENQYNPKIYVFYVRSDCDEVCCLKYNNIVEEGSVDHLNLKGKLIDVVFDSSLSTPTGTITKNYEKKEIVMFFVDGNYEC